MVACLLTFTNSFLSDWNNILERIKMYTFYTEKLCFFITCLTPKWPVSPAMHRLLWTRRLSRVCNKNSCINVMPLIHYKTPYIRRLPWINEAKDILEDPSVRVSEFSFFEVLFPRNANPLDNSLPHLFKHSEVLRHTFLSFCGRSHWVPAFLEMGAPNGFWVLRNGNL
jgi:hypothetical protein